VEDLINKVNKVFDKQFKTGDILEDRVYGFYWTNLPFASFVDCKYWHEQGKRIGEA
jgi:hypothetical protein